MNTAPGQNVLVLSPHPDDESLGCGGTLKLISSSGGQVDVLYMTRGEMGLEPGASASRPKCEELAQRRVEEARRACQVLGVRNIAFLNGRDAHLHAQRELAADVVTALRAQDYSSVFCPWPGDDHPDHAATYCILHQALQACGKELIVWLYEVWAPLPPNMAIAIDATMEAKLEAIRAHESQVASIDYARAFVALAQYRSLRCPPARYAEVFFSCDSAALLAGEDLPWPASLAGGAEGSL